MERDIKTKCIHHETDEEHRAEDFYGAVSFPIFQTATFTHPRVGQSTGFGSMLTFEVGTREQAVGILDHIRLIQYAESLGGVESLMTYPVTQTHADVPEELRKRNGLTDCVLRLSVGIVPNMVFMATAIQSGSTLMRWLDG